MAEEVQDAEEASVEEGLSLHELRLEAVHRELSASGATRVLDLGCGEGRLLRRLLRDKQFTEVVGVEVSHRQLEIAAERLGLDRLPERQWQRIQLLHGSLVYRDQRIAGYDAAAVVEVIEHLDSPRLLAFERVLFEFACPRTVVLTTPNREYNVRWPSLPGGTFRHRDHRFEWTRSEFRSWVQAVSVRHGYQAHIEGIGPEDRDVGTPSQMGVFSR